MADYPFVFRETLNNLERKSQSRLFKLSALREVNNDIRDGGNIPYEYGDRIVVGAIPDNSLITKVTAFVNNDPFASGTHIKLEFTSDFPAVTVTPLLKASLPVDQAHSTIHSFLSSAGNIGDDGSSIGSEDLRARVRLGDSPGNGLYYIVATFEGGTGVVTPEYAECGIIVEYARFGTNEGAY